MIRLPPRSTRTDTLFPYTTLFRSTTPVLFEKAHETRCFPRSPCWRTRTVRNAATHVARVVGMSAKVYGDCRSASDEPRIFGTVQARLRKIAQARRPSPHPVANSPNRRSTITMVGDASIPRRGKHMHSHATKGCRAHPVTCVERHANAHAKPRHPDRDAGMDRRVFIRAYSLAWNPDRLRPGRQCNPVRKGAWKGSAEGSNGTATPGAGHERVAEIDRKSTRLNSSH